MAHINTDADAHVEERARAVVNELRMRIGSDEPAPTMSKPDARETLDDAWSILAQVLAERSAPEASQLLDMLQQLSRIDHNLGCAEVIPGIERVLRRLETAQCSVAELVDMAPCLICELGFDRAFISRIHEGLWISEAVFVTGDPQWAEAINTVGRQHPQPLAPSLMETQLVRRRQPIAVYDVQNSSRVHRAIAEESQSRSYVAAPIMSGDRVVGMVHADRYQQKRGVDDADTKVLLSFAHAFQLALSRAALAEQLRALNNSLKAITTGLDTALNRIPDAGVVTPFDSAVTWTAGPAEHLGAGPSTNAAGAASVRDLLTRRELEVLEMVADGRTNAAIASRLVITEGTVKQHVKHILRKLRVQNRAEAVSRLYQSAP